MKLAGRDRDIWNAAIKAASKACRRAEREQRGLGEPRRRATRVNGPRNPHAHLSGELSLGALRAAQAVEELIQ